MTIAQKMFFLSLDWTEHKITSVLVFLKMLRKLLWTEYILTNTRLTFNSRRK